MVADLKPIPKNVADNVLDIEFWRKFAPDFTISEKGTDEVFKLSKKEKEAHVKKLEKEGYTHLMAPGIKASYENMTGLFGHMVDVGVPTVFSFVYDEMWDLRTQLRDIIRTLFDDRDYAQLPDFWGWHVSPGQAGWTPHRDKGANCLFPDKKPKSLTVWLPLNEAHPLNGCMYIVPADRDNNYGVPGPGGRIIPPNIRLPDVRALPGNAGDVLVWTQHAFHWGSRSAEQHHLPPRMSVAFEFQRLDVAPFNVPLLPMEGLPSFEQRLALIAKQVQQYTHMYDFGPDLIALSKKIQRHYDLPPSVHEQAATAKEQEQAAQTG